MQSDKQVVECVGDGGADIEQLKPQQGPKQITMTRRLGVNAIYDA